MTINIKFSMGTVLDRIRTVLRSSTFSDLVDDKNTALGAVPWLLPTFTTDNIKIRAQWAHLPEGLPGYPAIVIVPLSVQEAPSGMLGVGDATQGIIIGTFLEAPTASGTYDAEELLTLQLQEAEHCIMLALRALAGDGLKGDDANVGTLDRTGGTSFIHDLDGDDRACAIVGRMTLSVHQTTRTS